MSMNKRAINLLLTINLLFVFLESFVENPNLSYVIAGLSLIIIFVSMLNKKIRNISPTVFLLFLLFIFFASISSVVNGNATINLSILNLIKYGGIALGLLAYPLPVSNSKLLYGIVCSFFVYHILINSSPNEILLFSQNYISIYLLIFLGLIYISANEYDEEVKHFPVIIGLVITIWATGRSGIITFTILLLPKILLEGLSKKTNNERLKWFIKFIFLVSILVIIFMLSYETITERFVGTTLSQEPRFDIWSEYIRNATVSIENFFVGVPRSDLYFLNLYPHAHNSFISLHAQFGIIMLLMFLVLLIVTGKKLIQEHKFEFLLFMVAFFTRSFTDWVFPHYAGEIMLFYFTMYTFFDHRRIHESKLDYLK